MTNRDKGADPKDHADVPPVLPSEQPATTASGGVLTPDDLDFTDSPHVAEVSEGRYVVSADGPPNVGQPASTPASGAHQVTNPADQPRQGSDVTPADAAGTETNATADRAPIRSPEVARSVLAAELERSDARYALDIVSRFGSRPVRHRTVSDDAVGTFDSLVLWYAQHAAPKTPTQRTASLLLDKSEFDTPLSAVQVRQAAKRYGLDGSSTIDDLLDALE